MKVLVLSNGIPDAELAKACKHHRRVRAMPCELIETTLNNEGNVRLVKEHIGTTDVVLVASPARAWPPYWSEVADILEQSKAFIGIFSVDSWMPLWREGQKVIRVDAVLYTCKELYSQEYQSSFWTPNCWDVHESHERDIDILVWGNNGLPSYPFRDFILRELRAHVVGEPIIEDNEIIVRDVLIDGVKYKYCLLTYYSKTYWGKKLASLLSRTKICCTSSGHMFAPVGKYFENAACGAVTLTNDFTDREALGFEHGKHLWITDKETFTDDLTLLLHDYGLIDNMATNARALIAERHTPAIRGKELYDFLVNAIGVK